MNHRVELISAMFSILLILGIGCRGFLLNDASPHAVTHLETMGFSEIHVNEKIWFFPAVRGCGQDAARYDITASNPKGQTVDVSVCCGLFLKGCTLRTR